MTSIRKKSCDHEALPFRFRLHDSTIPRHQVAPGYYLGFVLQPEQNRKTDGISRTTSTGWNVMSHGHGKNNASNNPSMMSLGTLMRIQSHDSSSFLLRLTRQLGSRRCGVSEHPQTSRLGNQRRFVASAGARRTICGITKPWLS